MNKKRLGGVGASVAVLALALSGCQEDALRFGSVAPHPSAVSGMPGLGQGVAEPGRGAAPANVDRESAIGVAPQWIRPHFEAPRDACLNDAAVHCVLLEASESWNVRGPAFPGASLEVGLPHGSAAAFKERAASPLEGEDRGDVSVLRDFTRIEDLESPAADVARRLKDLEDYRVSRRWPGGRVPRSRM